MGCVTSKDHLEKLSSQLRYSPDGNLKAEEGDYLNLEKGGLYIKTSIGAIQFGIPPETIKDCINAKLEVPQYYIIPSERFEKKLGLSVAEFEFPSYFNFFIKKRKVNLLVDEEGEQAIRTIFQETLLGPKDLSTLEDEIQGGESSNQKDKFQLFLRKELDHFAWNPFNRKEKMTVETLINFMRYDIDGVIRLKQPITKNEDSSSNPSTNSNKNFNEIKIIRRDGYFKIYDNNIFRASFNDIMNIDPSKYPAFVDLLSSEMKDKMAEVEYFSHVKHSHSRETPRQSVTCTSFPKPILNRNQSFSIPDFGVTVLGNSHGFDCHGSTSGFIVWINKRGIMIDPPPFCSEVLRKENVPPNLIDKIILSHCHADHDAGAFQKVLDAGAIEIITTPTIMGSFTRKYAAVMGVPEGAVLGLFEFRPVPVFKDVIINGATFNFFYSFHAIPSIGFTVSLGGKTVYYSGDTFYHPKELKKLYEVEGIFSEERYKQLAFPNFEKFDLILHESGIPPIHTPISVLASLDPSIKEKIRLYHIAEKDLESGSGLQYARLGLENTEVLLEDMPKDSIIENLEVVSQIEILNELPLKRITDLLRCLKQRKYSKGDFILREGTKGKEFFLVKEGICKVYTRDPTRKFEKLKYSGDYFGENAVTSQSGIRNATVRAFTDCTLLAISRSDFEYCFGISRRDGNERFTLFGRMENLSKIRGSGRAECLNQNSVLDTLTELQKTSFCARLEEQEFPTGTVLWGNGKLPNFCFLLVEGEVEFTLESNMGTYTLNPGNLVGDFGYLLTDQPSQTEIKLMSKCSLMVMDKGDFVDYMRQNPGLHVFFKDKFIIE